MTIHAFLQHEFEQGVYSGVADKDAFRRAVESCKTRGYLKGIVEVEKIILYTGLTREEIEKLRDEMQPLAAG